MGATMNDCNISIICREVSRDTGEIAAYLCKKNVNSHDLQFCSLRARANPELKYYAIRTALVEDAEEWEPIQAMMQEPDFFVELESELQEHGFIYKL